MHIVKYLEKNIQLPSLNHRDYDEDCRQKVPINLSFWVGVFLDTNPLRYVYPLCLKAILELIECPTSLVEEIPRPITCRCVNPCKQWDFNYQPQLVIAGFPNHQQYLEDLQHPHPPRWRILHPGFLPGPLRLLMLPSSQLEAVAKNEEDGSNLSVEWIQDFLQHRNQMLGVF